MTARRRNTISVEVGRLRVTAGIHSKRGKLLRVKSKKFPYWIYYSIKDNALRVVAILDARQSPEKIYRRESKEQRSIKQL